MIHVYIHYPTRREARKISRMLLKKHLAACISFINQEDMYWWQGKIQQTRGVVTLVATEKKHYKKIESLVSKHHSFKVPAIMELPVGNVLKSYAQWLRTETK